MKISVEKTTLLKALDRCKSVTDAKSTMAILSHVRLIADPDELMGCLKIGATDLFQSVETKISASVDEEGSICVNARDLYDRVKQMPDGDVKLSLDGLALIVKAGKGPRKFKIHGIPVVEFPSLPKQTSNAEPIRIQDRGLAEKLESVLFAVSTDETRPFLNSVLFEQEVDSIRLVGTDGHRLAVLSSAGLEKDLVNRWLIPLKGAKEILKLLNESVSAKHEDHEVLIYPDLGNLFVVVNGFQYCCKLTDAQYPPYKQIMPTAHNTLVKVKRIQLIDSLKALRTTAGQARGVKLTFKDGKMQINANSEAGEGHDDLDCETNNNPTDDFSLNVDYFIDSIDPVCTEKVVIKLLGQMDPIVIEEDNDLKEYISIVMPIRL